MSGLSFRLAAQLAIRQAYCYDGVPCHGGARPNEEARRSHLCPGPPCLKRHVTPGDTRSIHPQRGVRIGEAAKPGPATATARTATTTDTAADTAPNGGAGPELAIQDVPIRIKMATGRTATLQCRWMPKTGSWRWWTGSGDSRFQHQGRSSPVLREWMRLFEMEVLQEGLDEINSVLALHPDLLASLPGAPPPHRAALRSQPPNGAGAPSRPSGYSLSFVFGTGGRYTDTGGPAGRPPDLRHDYSRCRGCPFWIGTAICTQRTLPASTLQIVDSICAAILTRLNDPISCLSRGGFY